MNSVWSKTRFWHFGFWMVLCATSQLGYAQDTDTTSAKSHTSKDVVFSFGLLYTNLSLTSEPYFADSAGKIGYSNIENSGGLSLGVGYNLYPGKFLLFRPAIEAVVLPGRITYDTDINYRKKSDVWPVALEVPLTLIYSRNIHGGVVADKRTWPEIGLGVRPAFALEYFFDMRPTVKTFNINADVVLGVPVQLRKAKARIELLYSYGFNNLIGVDENDLQTYTVKELGRSYFGLRVVLN